MEEQMAATSRTMGQAGSRFAVVAAMRGKLSARAKPGAPTEIGPLATIATAASFEPGATILMEGDPARHLFRIVSGIVKVHRSLADGRCQITGFLFPGDFIGLAPEDVYLSSAIAVGPVTSSRFPRKQVEQLVEVSPLVARLLLHRTCGELIAAQDQMLLLGRKTASEKVASFLRLIARRLQDDDITLPMTRADIADYLGLTIETVSRTLTLLREDGVIEVDRAHIRITRAAELEALAQCA
jgi:CRP/FNR family transcriptional regulator